MKKVNTTLNYSTRNHHAEVFWTYRDQQMMC